VSDIVQRLWGFCHTLRHEGIDYGDYIEQITYLLFLKMADEKGIQIPNGCSRKSGDVRDLLTFIFTTDTLVSWHAKPA
jgi:hypothetical protein